MPHAATARPDSQTPRLAALSIAGLWGLYWLILSFRSMFLYAEPLSMLGRRALVTLASAGLSALLYLVLRRVPTPWLATRIAVAVALAVPGALAYATVNWLVFDHWGEGVAWSWTLAPSHHHRPMPPAAPQPPVAPLVGAAPPAPPASPAPPMMSVGWMGDGPESPIPTIVDQASNGFFFFCAWAALYLALCYAAEVGALERRAAALGAAAQAAELRALRYQINPHFLFNTLNSLSSLVMTGRQDAAEKMLLNLASFFRTSLTGDPTEDVPLAEEIRLQRLYLDIESVRFPDRLRVAIEVPPALEAVCVPGLILQPLVENAVKYGVSRATRPVTVTIRAEAATGALRLIVTDDGDPTPDALVEGTGTGLRNVRDRLAARYGEAGYARWGATGHGGFAVVLEMPAVPRDC